MLRCRLASKMAFHASSGSKKTSRDKVANLASVVPHLSYQEASQKKKKKKTDPRRPWAKERRHGWHDMTVTHSNQSRCPAQHPEGQARCHPAWGPNGFTQYGSFHSTQHCCLRATPTQRPPRSPWQLPQQPTGHHSNRPDKTLSRGTSVTGRTRAQGPGVRHSSPHCDVSSCPARTR